jgi:hypothetical protein
LESSQRLAIAGQFVGQELQRDEAMEPGVLGFVDHAHAAAAELLDDAVVREGLPDQGIGVRRSVVVVVVGELVSPTLGTKLANDNLLFFSLFILYYTLFEFFLDWTPGKVITGTRVVTDTGGAPSFQQLLVRAVVRLVPFEPLSFLGDPPIGWHDRWSRTRLIRTQRKSSLDRTYDLRRSGRRPPGAWHPEPMRSEPVTYAAARSAG